MFLLSPFSPQISEYTQWETHKLDRFSNGVIRYSLLPLYYTNGGMSSGSRDLLRFYFCDPILISFCDVLRRRDLSFSTADGGGKGDSSL